MLSDDSDMAAQPPLVSNLPHFARERPGSSRSNHSSNGIFGQLRTSQRPKREARKPPVSFRKPASSASMPYANPVFGADDKSDAGSLISARGRTNSITSTSSGRHRDLLDVLEEIRPTEFRSRVLATGAKDYGEDVADRNIRQSLMTASTPNLKGQSDSDRVYPSSSSISSQQGSSLRSRTRSPSSFTTSRLTSGYTPRDFDSGEREESSSSSFLEPGSFSRRNKNRLSLNTYIPSGLEAPNAPRSAATTPGDGISAIDFVSIRVDSEALSRRYHLSPTGSNFSVPRSPRIPASNTTPVQGGSPAEVVRRAVEPTVQQQFGDVFTNDNTSNQRRSGSSAGQTSTARSNVRFSNQTYRSSLASSVASRNASLDFTPLCHPPSHARTRSSSTADINRFDDFDNRRRPMSMRKPHISYSPPPPIFTLIPMLTGQEDSHRPTRSEGSEDSFRHSRTKSVISAPSALRNLVEVDEHGAPAHSGGTGDETLATPSNGSTTSSTNLYSGGSSGRPASRHTKATSVDSTNGPPSSRKSEDSFLSSQSRGQQSGTGWSPTTTRSTGFNIDDYISSDEESFTTEKTRRRPTADGEEELLFKNAFNGALPGLLESAEDGACPAPVVRMRRSRSNVKQEIAAARDWQPSNDELVAPDMDDRRVSVDREMPMTLLRHVRSGPDDGNLGTFGRRSRKVSQETVSKPAVADEWSSNIMYDNMPSPTRNQKRLSALGTLHGRGQDSAIFFDGPNSPDFMRHGSHNNELVKVGATIREEGEKLDHAAAIRLWKEAKMKKRAEDARFVRERRMTRAFGDLEEDIAAMLRAQSEVEELERRGRTLSRAGRG